jgi:quinol monooxygenase YgiN
MFIKWITCEVTLEDKPKFSKAQEKWSATSEVSGFLGQIGGWDERNLTSACILSFWKDQESYALFMMETHDPIEKYSRQNLLYNMLVVDFFNPLSSISENTSNLNALLNSSKHLRVADCTVKSHRISHFKEVQTSVWIPSMKKAEGMLGGHFSLDDNNNSRFMISTLWDSSFIHDKYRTEQLPALYTKTEVMNDLEEITDWSVMLEPSWLVLPT